METQNTTIEKSTAEIYKIRNANGSFANITLDYSGKQGRISISTDYGNWSYYWGACGSEFKKFIVGLDMDYTAGKFGESNWFDHDATIIYLRDRIKTNSDNKQHKNEMLSELETLKDCENKEVFVNQMWQCSKIMELEDSCPDLITGVSPGFRYFWENLWNFFIDYLKQE